MCETCDNGICTNGCMAQTQVVKVASITPHPLPGAVGDETDHKHETVQEQFDRLFKGDFREGEA